VGYVHFERARDEAGRIRGGRYLVREIPEVSDQDSPEAVDRAAPIPPPAALSDSSTTGFRSAGAIVTTLLSNEYFRKGHDAENDAENKDENVAFPACVPVELRGSAQRLVAGLDPRLAQQVIDEWAGIMADGAIRSSPLGCLRGLIKRASEDSFTPVRAVKMAQAREARQHPVASRERAQTEPSLSGPVDDNNPLVKHLKQIARRHQQG
jgi:hypothetical protein